jgi:hypothetical protein
MWVKKCVFQYIVISMFQHKSNTSAQTSYIPGLPTGLLTSAQTLLASLQVSLLSLNQAFLLYFIQLKLIYAEVGTLLYDRLGLN